jgi:alkanesulfonate monooxygenase SsuD/methylene tetrahydromethanopterin reductase-like flavin-dependent oxidoreductase (luciferase family)
MHYGLHLPLLEPHTMVELAVAGEQAGWDGVFIWDAIWGLDIWVVLAAIATQTSRLRLAPYLTPPSRRRPWKLASEAATLDQLSHGRAILPVGLGAPETGFDKVGEETDRKVRAQMLDESLAIINRLWTGKLSRYQGSHYQLRDMSFEPLPVQKPRVPIWVVGAWPRPKSMQRAIQWDGIIPTKLQPEGQHEQMQPADIQEMQHYIQIHRSADTPFEVVLEGETPADDLGRAQAITAAYADVGVTWWLENVWDTPWKKGGVEGMRQRIQQGPPRGSD